MFILLLFKLHCTWIKTLILHLILVKVCINNKIVHQIQSSSFSTVAVKCFTVFWTSIFANFGGIGKFIFGGHFENQDGVAQSKYLTAAVHWRLLTDLYIWSVSFLLFHAAWYARHGLDTGKIVNILLHCGTAFVHMDDFRSFDAFQSYWNFPNNHQTIERLALNLTYALSIPVFYQHGPSPYPSYSLLTVGCFVINVSYVFHLFKCHICSNTFYRDCIFWVWIFLLFVWNCLFLLIY